MKTRSTIQFLHKHGVVLLVLCLFIIVGSISSNNQLRYERLQYINETHSKEIEVLKKMTSDNQEEHKKIITLIEQLHK